MTRHFLRIIEYWITSFSVCVSMIFVSSTAFSCSWYSQSHFLTWKLLLFDPNVIEICSQWYQLRDSNFTLTLESCDDARFVFTCGTGGCHNDNINMSLVIINLISWQLLAFSVKYKEMAWQSIWKTYKQNIMIWSNVSLTWKTTRVDVRSEKIIASTECHFIYYWWHCINFKTNA